MSRILRLIGPMACVAVLFWWGLPRAATNTARADDCLAQPDSTAPEGSHWYFHTDRATQRKCWYLRAPDQQAEQPAAHTSSPVTSTTPIPLEKPETATSQAIAPVSVEKPKTVASRVKPTTPIPLEKPASASAGAPMPVIPSTPAPPLPHIKMLTVVSSGAANTLGQQDAKQPNNNTAITAASAPELSPSQTSERATEPGLAATMWPDPSKSPLAITPEATTATTPQATTATIQEATTPDHVETPTTARTEAATASNQQSALGAESADLAVVTAQGDAATDKPAAANASILPEPIEMSLVAAVGLVIAGFLFRIAMKIADARRRRIIVDQSESHWLDNPDTHEPRDARHYVEAVNQRQELIDEFMERPESDGMDDRNELALRDGEQQSELFYGRANLVDQLRDSLVTTASDDAPRRLLRNDDELQESLQHTDRGPIGADEIRKREDTLEQLKRDLDRLLRTPKVAQPI